MAHTPKLSFCGTFSWWWSCVLPCASSVLCVLSNLLCVYGRILLAAWKVERRVCSIVVRCSGGSMVTCWMVSVEDRMRSWLRQVKNRMIKLDHQSEQDIFCLASPREQRWRRRHIGVRYHIKVVKLSFLSSFFHDRVLLMVMLELGMGLVSQAEEVKTWTASWYW